MNKVQYFEHNTIGRDFVIGDLHGSIKPFQRLLKHINFDTSKDRMFSVGDLVDRGPDNVECLQLLYEPWFRAVRGNHEDMMIQSIINDNESSYINWLRNGGSWVQFEDEDLIRQLAGKVNELPYIIVIGKDDERRFNIVHAELNKAMDENMATDEDIDEWFFNDYNETNLIWGRGIATMSTMPGSFKNFDRKYGLSPTIVGHTPFDYPRRFMNHIFIDTGAVFNNETNHTFLSCLELDKPDRVLMYDITNDYIKDFYFNPEDI